MARIPEELRRRIKGALGVDPPEDLDGEALLSYIEEVRKTSPALYRELVDALQEQAALEIGRPPSVKTPRPLSLARFFYKQDAEGNWVFDRRRGIALTLVVVLMVIFLIQFLMTPRGGKAASTKAWQLPTPQLIQNTNEEGFAQTAQSANEKKTTPPKGENKEGTAPTQGREEKKEAGVPPPPEAKREGNAPPPPPPNPTPDLPPPPDYEGGAQAETGIVTLYRREKAEGGSSWAPVRSPAQAEQAGQNAPAGGPFLIRVREGSKASESTPPEGNGAWISLSTKGKDQAIIIWQKASRETLQGGETSAWIRRETPNEKETKAPLLITPQKAPSAPRQGEIVTVYKRSEKNGGSWAALDGTPSTLTGKTPNTAQGEGQEKTNPPASENAQTPSTKPAEEQKTAPPPEEDRKEETKP